MMVNNGTCIPQKHGSLPLTRSKMTNWQMGGRWMVSNPWLTLVTPSSATMNHTFLDG